MAALDWENINLTAPASEPATLLPPGDYDFTVVSLERGMHTAKAGGKIGNCPKAEITIRIESDAGNASLRERLYLDDSCLGIISAFFNSLGCYDSPNWAIEGKTGRCKVKTRQYDGNTYNEVARWLAAPQPAESKALSAF